MLKDSVRPRKGRLAHRPHYDTALKIRAIEDSLKQQIPVRQVCRRANISPTIFYRWRSRYQKAGSTQAKIPFTKTAFNEHLAIKALENKQPSIYKYVGQVSAPLEKLIVKTILENPRLSVAGIVKALPKLNGKPVVGHHGVQNVLRRQNLNTLAKRQSFSDRRGFSPGKIFSPIFNRVRSVFEKFTPQKAAAPPPVEPELATAAPAFKPTAPVPETTPTFQIPAQISTKILLKFAISYLYKGIKHLYKLPLRLTSPLYSSLVAFGLVLATGVILNGLVSFGWLIFTAKSASQAAGYIFSSLALLFGTFFFLYSLKYYLGTALILLFSRKMLSGGSDKAGISAPTAPGLDTNINQIKLTRHPFVSIHLPLYNEKRVVNRLLEAVTSMEYDNYEVVVCDDSTDETKDMILEWQHHPRIKISHRETREGFKGGALREAVKLMDPKTEFVIVFDSDFLPFPDTIEQFLKYFQTAAGTLDFEKVGKVDKVEKVDTPSSSTTFPTSSTSSTCRIAAIQGYQWHVLNKSENWVTRGVRTEYAGSYIIERSGAEVYGGLKQIAGSVYMIRADILNHYQWGTSITEDFELTLKLYADGYKVVYTPYIQTPSECVSTLKRLVRQRMRWAEGHSFNIKKYFRQILFAGTRVQGLGSSEENNHSQLDPIPYTLNPKLTLAEKLEFLYLAPYYLQSAFFMAGTFFWFVAEAGFRVTLPFWTSVWGWSLVLTNLLSLPLMNLVGMFMEEAEEKDYVGLFSFVMLTYLVAPFQAYAAIKGFMEKTEGPWFRTPKTGKITDVFKKGRLFGWLKGLISWGAPTPIVQTSAAIRTLALPAEIRMSAMLNNSYLGLTTANNKFDSFRISKGRKSIGNITMILLLISSMLLTRYSTYINLVGGSNLPTGFVSLAEAKEIKADEEIRGQIIEKVSSGTNSGLEYIFHEEPRIRTKFSEYEIEMSLINPKSQRTARAQKSIRTAGGSYEYREVFEDIDLRVIPRGASLKEEIVLKNYKDVQYFEYRLKVLGLALTLYDSEILFAPKDGGEPEFSYTKPFMYEASNSDVRSEGIVFELENMGNDTYSLRKSITTEGLTWLQDPARVYPVIIDPTMVKSNLFTGIDGANRVNLGSQHTKIAYSSTAAGGAAWYVIHQKGADIYYQRCLASTSCNEDGDWSTAVEIDQDSGTDAHYNATLYHVSDSRIWVTWTEDFGVDPDDTIHIGYIDTTSTYPHSLSNHCESADQGTIVAGLFPYIAAGTNDDVLVGYSSLGNTNTISDIWQVESGGCTFTTIEASSGVETTVADLGIGVVAKGNVVHMIYEDNATNDLRHSVFDLTDGTDAWASIDNNVDGADNIDEAERFAITTDGTDIWVLAQDGTIAVDFFRCSNCPTSSPTWTTTDAIPWSSETNLTDVSLSYVSGTNKLAAFAIMDTSEQAYTIDTDADTISWGTEYSMSYTAGTLETLSSPKVVSSEDHLATVTWQNDATDPYRFSTVPENYWVLYLLIPFLPILLPKIRNLGRQKG